MKLLKLILGLGLLAAQAQAYYNPATGRWLSRDPIGEKGGANEYAFAGNNPVGAIDSLGMWGTNVHKVMTSQWAFSVGYSSEGGGSLGDSTDAVDGLGGGRSWMPKPFGDQSYHFNRNTSGNDSRLEHHTRHFAAAKSACARDRDDPELASREFGLGMHPLQDYVAHGDHNRGSLDAKVPAQTHNAQSPQGGDVGSFPDDPNLDAVGGSDGIPSWGAIRFLTKNGTRYDYVIYRSGNRRIRLTEQFTKTDLREFRTFLETSGGCRCKTFFLGNKSAP